MIRVLAPALVALAVRATQLPSVPSEHADARAGLEVDGKWWAQMGDRVYYAPDSESGLSDHIGHYYYALGSKSALSEQMKAHRVGGQGRLHIFHLPHGPSMLQLGQRVGNRRSSISDLSPLKHGMVFKFKFPEYQPDPAYVNPLSPAAQEVERQVVASISGDTVWQYLTEITSFPTRTTGNAEASKSVQSFLESKFKSMSFQTCMQDFGTSTNVLAFIQGSGEGYVVVGAHYDSIPSAGSAPGAEDNGSGLAAMLTMAKAFAEAGVAPVRSVYFVAFAAEEAGLLGSAAFARWLGSPPAASEGCRVQGAGDQGAGGFFGRRTRRARRGMQGAEGVIIMDEVGWRSPKLQGPVVNLESYDWTGDVMQHLVNSCHTHNGAELTVVHSNHPFGSDHMSFLNGGTPAVLTINGDDEAYPFYHTSQDKMSSVDRDLVKLIARMNMGALLRMSGIKE